MAQKYKFRLEALLKLRKIKEDQCKQEIGRLQVEIRNVENLIEDANKDISYTYESQQKSLQKGLMGREIKFYPMIVESKWNHIELMKNKIKEINKVVQKKLDELKLLRADTKLMENLKEKDLEKFKKAYNKEQELKREDMNSIWSSHLKTGTDV